jgi:iron complex transport system permease protein
LLRNPLAEPGVLGVSASAALAAASALAFGAAAVWPFAPAAAAIGGALAATALIGAAALRTAGVVALILIGVGLSSFAGALMALVLNLAPNPFALSDLVSWMLGSVANRSFADIALVAPILAAGVVLLRLSGRGLTVLSLGEEAAAGAGLDLVRTRLLVILGAGLATGASVALAGAIGFVGIVAPHLARPLVGHDPARTLAPSALIGGAMLALADVLARIAPGDTELRLGVVAALIGAPAFVWIAAQRRGDGV